MKIPVELLDVLGKAKAAKEAAAKAKSFSGRLNSLMGGLSGVLKKLVDLGGNLFVHTFSYAIGQATSIIFTPLFRSLEYEMNQKVSNMIPDVGSLINLRLLQIITVDKYYEYMSMLSYSKEQADNLYSTRRQLLDVGSIQHLYNRGELTETETKERFEQLGFLDREKDELIKLAGFIPSVGDFVRFAVREVFSPVTAEKYGQYEDYPTDFDKYAKLAGLNPDYAKYYWAAHWDLPSFSQASELYHRSIISIEELTQLLKAQDVMPFWRDKIIKLAETPYTRVDVRRMYQLGIMTVEEVLRSYMDLGYSEEKAKKMTLFATQDNPSDTKDLTKVEILASYESGLIDSETCIEVITSLGYSKNEAQTLVSLNDIKRLRGYTNKLISSLKREFLNERLTEENARASLSQLNLKSDAIEETIMAWSLDILPKLATPTKAELLKWYGAGKITVKILQEQLSNMGYSSAWINLYVGSAKIITEVTE